MGSGKAWYVMGVTVLVMALAGCSSSPRNPADIRPEYSIRYAPIPVPKPRIKPSVQKVQARARRAASGGIVVRGGDTLYSIARRLGLPLEDLIDANGLRAPYTLYVGQRLKLSNPAIHSVRRGETAYSISQQYGLQVADLMRQNRIVAPYTLQIGQRLTLPRASANARRTGRPIPSAATPARTSRPQVQPVPPRSSGRFSWPLRGTILSRFGRRKDGAQNDGINIAGRRGAPIVAAENGVVVYASDALQGYGNLLLIRHAGGWVTAYAHADKLGVVEGDQVKKGQKVATVGTTGGLDQPQLHFEVRKGRNAIDPMTVLGAR